MTIQEVAVAQRLARGHEKPTKIEILRLAREAKEIVKIVEEKKNDLP